MNAKDIFNNLMKSQDEVKTKEFIPKPKPLQANEVLDFWRIALRDGVKAEKIINSSNGISISATASHNPFDGINASGVKL